MPIPLRRAMETDIHIVVGLNQLIRQSRCAATTEDDPVVAERSIRCFIPPTLVAKLHDVLSCRLKLADNVPQPRAGKMKTRWQLEEEASKMFPQQVGNVAKISDERASAGEPFDMRDQLADFHRVDELAPARLLFPRYYGVHSGPGVERCIQFDRAEVLGVMSKPPFRRQALRVENATPMPVKPAGAPDVNTGFPPVRRLRGRSMCFVRESYRAHFRGPADVCETLFIAPLLPFSAAYRNFLRGPFGHGRL